MLTREELNDISTFKQLSDKLREEGVILTTKTGAFWSFLHKLLVILSFGTNQRFLTSMITTIGPVIAVPEKWKTGRLSKTRKAIIRHEQVHVNQYERMGMGNAWAGVIPFVVAYLLLPVPVGFAWMRWKLEREAYLEGMKTEIALGLQPRLDKAVDAMTTGSYVWTLLPLFRGYVRGWYEARL